jgi:hypothetical protein
MNVACELLESWLEARWERSIGLPVFKREVANIVEQIIKLNEQIKFLEQ